MEREMEGRARDLEKERAKEKEDPLEAKVDSEKDSMAGRDTIWGKAGMEAKDLMAEKGSEEVKDLMAAKDLMEGKDLMEEKDLMRTAKVPQWEFNP